MLSHRGRSLRGLAVACVLVALLAGTFWGDDDHFPFGPFKMYAGTARISDPVDKMLFEGETAAGEVVPILAREFGLRPAEIEGQLDRVVREPALLAHLVRAYEEINPDAPRLTAFRVMHETYQLRDRRPVAYSKQVLAEWRRGEVR